MKTASIFILLFSLLVTASAADGRATNLRELRKGDEKGDKSKGKDKKDKAKNDKNKPGKGKTEVGFIKGRFEDRFKDTRPFEDLDIESLMDLDYKDAGTLHNAAFEVLALSIDTNKNQINPMELMMEVNNIMGAMCPAGDMICESMTSKATVRAFQQEETHSGVLTFPDSMDNKVEQHLRLAQTVIQSMDGSNTEDAINMLQKIEDDLEAMRDVVPEYQNAGIASVSVARKSAELWTKVFEDEKHPLHMMVLQEEKITHDDRRLQAGIDVTGTAVNVTVQVNYDIIIDNVQEAVVETVAAALQAVEGVVNLVNVVITNMVNLTVETIAATVEAVREAVMSVVDQAIQVVVTVKNLGQAVAQGAVQVATQAVDTTVAVANATVQAGITVATTAATVVVDTVETGVDATVALANATIQAAGAVVDATIDVAVAVGGAVVETAVDVVETVAEGVVEVVETVAEGVVEVVEETVETLKEAFSRISSIIDADFVGASNGSAAMVDLVVGNPTYLFPLNWLPLGVVVAFWYSFPASAAAAFRIAMR